MPPNTGVLQEVAAPFVLGGLGCTGDEQRLIDCRADRSIESDDGSGDYGYGDYGLLSGPCEPVFLACGTLADGGATPPGCCPVTARCLFSASQSYTCSEMEVYIPIRTLPALSVE